MEHAGQLNSCGETENCKFCKIEIFGNFCNSHLFLETFDIAKHHEFRGWFYTPFINWLNKAGVISFIPSFAPLALALLTVVLVFGSYHLMADIAFLALLTQAFGFGTISIGWQFLEMIFKALLIVEPPETIFTPDFGI